MCYISRNVTSYAKKKRIFLEQQVVENQDRLKNIEETLMNFSESTKTIFMDYATSELISRASTIMSEIASIEVECSVMDNFLPPGDPKIMEKKKSIEALREKLDFLIGEVSTNRPSGEQDEVTMDRPDKIAVPFNKVPILTIEYLRLKQNLLIQQQILALIQKELEISRIDEATEEISFQIIDYAHIPKEPVSPNLLFNCFVAVVFSTLIGLAVIVFRTRSLYS